MADLILPDKSYGIIGACFAVYNEIGHCYTEPLCHECLEIEFEYKRIPFLSKPPCTLKYRDRVLQKTFEPDFICFEKVVLEIKALPALTDAHRAQIVNYVHATDLDLGLLVNFGSYPKLQYERFLHRRHRRPPPPSDEEPPSF